MIINVGEGGGVSNADKLKYNNETSGLSADNVQGAIDEVKEAIDGVSESFQAGCDTIVSSITAQGVTPKSNSPADISTAVNTVATNKYNAGVTDTKVGTALVTHVLADKTFTNSNGVGLKGTMVNNGAVTGSITSSGGTYTIPVGYHNGSGKVSGATLAQLVGTNVNLDNAGNLLSGVTAYGKNGTKYTGTMANKGAWNNTPTSKGKVTIPAGYHNGSGYVDTTSVYNAGVSSVASKFKYEKFTFSSNTKTISVSSKPKLVVWCGNAYMGHIYSDGTYTNGKSINESITEYDTRFGSIAINSDSIVMTSTAEAQRVGNHYILYAL